MTWLYTLLGRIVWRLGGRVARRKLGPHRPKLIAAAVVFAVLIAGFAAAHGDDSE